MAKVLTTTKTSRRAADRAFMANAIIEMAKSLNLTHERIDDPTHRAILVQLKAESGLQVGVDLDGSMRDPDVHLLSWNMHYDPTQHPRRLNNATFGGNVNPHHKMKATYIAHGFEDLLVQLEKGFTMANDGTAYLS